MAKTSIEIQGVLVPKTKEPELMSSSNLIGGYHIVTSQEDLTKLLSYSSVGLQEVGMIINLHIEGDGSTPTTDKYYRITRVAAQGVWADYPAETEEITFGGGGDEALDEPITTTIALGGYDSNVTIQSGTTFEAILRQLLSPVITASTSDTKTKTLTITPNLSTTSFYNGGTVSITSITITPSHVLTYYTINQSTKAEETVTKSSTAFTSNIKYGSTTQYDGGSIENTSTTGTITLGEPIECGTFSTANTKISGYVSGNTSSAVLSGETRDSNNHVQVTHTCYYGTGTSNMMVKTGVNTLTMKYKIIGGYAYLGDNPLDTSSTLDNVTIQNLSTTSTSTTVAFNSTSDMVHAASMSPNLELIVPNNTIPANTRAYILIPQSLSSYTMTESYTSSVGPYSQDLVKLSSTATINNLTYCIYAAPSHYGFDTSVASKVSLKKK